MRACERESPAQFCLVSSRDMLSSEVVSIADATVCKAPLYIKDFTCYFLISVQAAGGKNLKNISSDI